MWSVRIVLFIHDNIMLARVGKAARLGHVRSYATVEGINRYSRIVTQPKDQGASQAMLFATEGVDTDNDLQKAMVGVASVW